MSCRSFYNVADFGREMFSIPLKMAISLMLLLASPFQEEGELMLQLFLATGASIASVFPAPTMAALISAAFRAERYHQ